MHIFLEIAKLHKDQLKVGVLAELNELQLAKFYQYMAAMPHLASLFVCISSDEKICGFASGTTNIKLFYKEFLKSRWFYILKIISSLTVKPKMYRRLFSIGSYLHHGPKIATSIDSEILSFVVSPTKHRGGLGQKMFEAIRTYFSQHNISTFKVTAAHTQIAAQLFYQKMGGTLIGNMDLGLLTSSVYKFECKNQSPP